MKFIYLKFKGLSFKMKCLIGFCIYVFAATVYLENRDKSNDPPRYTKVSDIEVKEDLPPVGQFSQWNGEHYKLTKHIKGIMKDAGSYQHVQTSYLENTEGLIITTQYRGKNALGALEMGSLTAQCNKEGDILNIISSE